ncbi:AcrR family transcriptional regulator [Pelistega indica]|uniref:AcrR family transcriptional regulator n=2 Tax=Alcaligenaceae TaxID=506 RepID=V8G112_9BURK|nr:AcrR family transcriptional regulator [Pelistega indica]
MLFILGEFMAEQKIDKRIIRTKSLIHNAFLTLLAEKEYKHITVQDILNTADINRTTFYKHYKSKQGLASELMNNFKKEFLVPVSVQRFNYSAREFIYGVSPMVKVYRPLIKLFLKIQTPEMNFVQELQKIAKTQYIEHVRSKTGKTEQELDFQAHMFATLAVEFLRYCLLNDVDISSKQHDEMLEMFKYTML